MMRRKKRLRKIKERKRSKGTINYLCSLVGNVSSVERSGYTPIGNAVNVAPRLESIAKESQRLITQSTYDEVVVEVKEGGFK